MAKIAPDTRFNILMTAFQLFLEKGYKAVSYQDLVKETGLSKGAIYHYFESKEALLIAVFEFLLEFTKEPAYPEPRDVVKDRESFLKVFIDSKMIQIQSFKKMMGDKPLKLNKLLFFFEAISENVKLRQIIMQLSKYELSLLESYFTGLKKHNNVPGGKDTALLAQSLYWMLQGAEMTVLFMEDNDWEEPLIKIYHKTINDFFDII